MIMTVSDLDKMKVQDMPPFENAYERFIRSHIFLLYCK